MNNQKSILLLLVGILMVAPAYLQAQTEEKTPNIQAPTNQQEAEKLFSTASKNIEDNKFEEAKACLKVLVDYFDKRPGLASKRYAMLALNDLGMIQARLGQIDEAKESFYKGENYARELKDWQLVSDFNFKLGIIYSTIAVRDKGNTVGKNAGIPIYPGIYTPIEGPSIEIGSMLNPYVPTPKLFAKNLALLVYDDFNPNPDELLVPDSVELSISLTKRGYYPIDRRRLLLPEKDTDLIQEVFITKDRRVRAVVKEDFLNQQTIADELTLAAIIDGKESKPRPITDQDKFKPGSYVLRVKKYGYTPIEENLVIYPDEDDYFLSKNLLSMLRQIIYKIEGDYVLESQIKPDEITLNGKPITDETKFKPDMNYTLVIRKEGYEPITEKLQIKPDEKPYPINRLMKTLEREVVFQFTSDYENRLVQADEVRFNQNILKSGESVKPHIYGVQIHKRGYETLSKKLTIPPLSKAFVFQETLISSPRRVEHNITTRFPPGKKITPNTLTLDTKSALQGERFKPGQYELVIENPGYMPVKKIINIPPDVTPYTVIHLLTPKPRLVVAKITQDVPPDDPKIEYKLSLSSESLGVSCDYKEGLTVEPQNYAMRLSMPGYDNDVANYIIEPQDQPFVIERKLISSNRKVISKITAEFPLDATVVPDEITLGTKPLRGEFSIKPGTHDLMILKEGYEPIREKVFIGASDKEFLLFKRLITIPRDVKVLVKDSIDKRSLTPDEIVLDKDTVKSDSTFKRKPGEYTISIRLKGYHPLTEKEVIPVGVGTYTIEKYLTASTRDVKSMITGDFDNKPLVPDLYTLNKIPVTEKTAVAPGNYELVIQKSGYEPIRKSVDIPPSPEPYLIKEMLVSKLRKLILDIRSSFPPQKIEPEKLLFNDKEMKNDSMVKPAVYQLTIENKGYKSIKEELIIPPSEDPYVLSKLLEAIPRLVTYEIFGDFEPGELQPDAITLDGKTVDGKTQFLPNKYTLKIEKRGYQTKERPEIIQPSDTPYRIREKLLSLPRELKFRITGEWPPDEIPVEMIALNGQEYDNTPQKPGQYELDIRHTGFFPLKEKIVITPDIVPFLIERVMKTKPVLLEEKISFDVPPGDLGTDYKITIAPWEDKKSLRELRKGDTVKPGEYEIIIRKPAYRDIDEKLRILPREKPFQLEYQLEANLVVILVNIDYDVPPPPDLGEYVVSLVDVKTGYPRSVRHGGKIKPGHYKLDIQQPGYQIASAREIKIPPSLYPFEIREKLLAKKRPLSFKMVYKEVMIRAIEVLINGQKVTADDLFQPGTEVDMVAKFEKYETVQKKLKIIPGHGEFIAPVELKELTKYEFELRRIKADTIVLDEIQYPFEYYADNQKIESHHIKKDPGVNSIYFSVMVPKEAKDFKIVGGYLYNQVPFAEIHKTSASFNRIDATKLIDHLEQVKKVGRLGLRSALEVVKNLVTGKNNEKLMKALSSEDVTQLMRYVESWKLEDAQDINTKKVVIETLEKLKKSG